MADLMWDGMTRGATLTPWALRTRHGLADAARRYDWPAVFEILGAHALFVNSFRPDGVAWYAPLHQVAHAGAPVDVAERLIAIGAWRGLRNASGERPADVAARLGHRHLRKVLTPPRHTGVPPDVLAAVQARFHDLIRFRAERLVVQERLRLPELEVLPEMPVPRVWFPVPGMYGGFRFELRDDGLVVDSENRIVGGSAQRHRITADATTEMPVR